MQTDEHDHIRTTLKGREQRREVGQRVKKRLKEGWKKMGGKEQEREGEKEKEKEERARGNGRRWKKERNNSVVQT